ncbi:MAG: TlpA family protein disulfide reductase [Candidatus Azobacteroides sp.]|nr:TlpA family protein disulfide reductase [Candidatus Azobacteroides sp.]
MAKRLILVFVFVAGFLSFFSSCRKPFPADNRKSASPESTGYIVKRGDSAPLFIAYTTDSMQMQLAALKGGVIMLQFTASWCSVCRAEMPVIESEIWQKYKSNPNFSLFAVDLKEPVEKIRPFIADTKITYPVLLDPDGKIFKLFALEDAGVTRNVIIDKEGKIAMLTRLYDKDEFGKMIQCIDSLLRIR